MNHEIMLGALNCELASKRELRVSPDTKVEDFTLEGVPAEVIDACEAIRKIGGTALIVGGSVRDGIMNREHRRQISPKDFDIEVYGLTAEELDAFLAQHFGSENIVEVGKAFGIVKVKIDGFAEPLDFSLPRRESKKGEGHKGFETNSDPFMSLEEAAKRRDITANSMAYNPLTHKLYDPFGGVEDIRNKIIRATDYEKFAEDPLRVLRVAQFAGRFGFEVEKGTFDLCAHLVEEGELDINNSGDEKAKGLSKERIGEEFIKLFLKSERPSVGFRFLKEIGYLKKYLPMLEILDKTPQEHSWHPEGNVFEHTMQVMDAAAAILRTEKKAGRLLISTDLTEIDNKTGKFYTEEKIRQGRDILIAVLKYVDSERVAEIMYKAIDFRMDLMAERIERVLTKAAECKYMFAEEQLLQMENEALSATLSMYWKKVDELVASYRDECLVNGLVAAEQIKEVEILADARALKASKKEKELITRDIIEEKSLVLMFGAMAHDLGKPSTTDIIDGKITSRNHEAEGVEPTRKMMEFFNKMKHFSEVRRQILPLVGAHLKPPELFRQAMGTIQRDGSGEPYLKGARKGLGKVSKKMIFGDGNQGIGNFSDGGGTSFYMLCLVAKADQLGRNPAGYPFTESEKRETLDWFDWCMKENSERAEIKETASVVSGQEILDTLGLSTKDGGPWIKIIMDCVDKDDEEDLFENRNQALAKIHEYYSRLESWLTSLSEQVPAYKVKSNIWTKLKGLDPRTVI